MLYAYTVVLMKEGFSVWYVNVVPTLCGINFGHYLEVILLKVRTQV